MFCFQHKMLKKRMNEIKRHIEHQRGRIKKEKQNKRCHGIPNYRSRVINILNIQVSHINRRIIEFGAESNVIKFK